MSNAVPNTLRFLAAAAPRTPSAELTLARASNRARRVRDSEHARVLEARLAFREATRLLEESANVGKR